VLLIRAVFTKSNEHVVIYEYFFMLFFATTSSREYKIMIGDEKKIKCPINSVTYSE
jgi:hypothetical protein